MIWKNFTQPKRPAVSAPPCRLLLLWVVALLIPYTGQSQRVPKQFEAVDFQKRASFGKLPPNWTFADSVTIHPDRPAPLRVFPGNQILVGKPGEAATLSFNAKNFRLYISYTLSSKTSLKITLPTGGFVVLSEGKPSDADRISGYTGQVPDQDAGKMAGLTQNVEIDYESLIPGVPGKTRINEIKLNGVTVAQGQYVTDRTEAPLSLQVTHGTAVIKSIGLQRFDNRKPIALQDLSYKVYSDAWDSRKTELLSESGKSPVLTCEVAEGKKSYNLVYEGDLVIDENGDYDFTTIYTGAYCQLAIAGNVVLDTDQSSSQETQVTNVRLEKGTHRFKLWYSKLPWANAALGLRVGKSGIRPYDLHALSSLPQPRPKPFMVLESGSSKPEMVRSFIQLPAEKHKRTHCLSVASPTGRNYSVDLNRGALLQVWRGQFANVTEMWYERGEPQLLTTMGLTEAVSGRSSFVNLANQSAPWVDSAAVSFLDYRLNAKGYPTFRYSLGPAIIHDALTPHEKGITRTVTPERNTSAGHYILLAEGRQITLIERGLYVVDGRYYIKTNGTRTPVLRSTAGTAELLLPITGPVSYSILW